MKKKGLLKPRVKTPTLISHLHRVNSRLDLSTMNGYELKRRRDKGFEQLLPKEMLAKDLRVWQDQSNEQQRNESDDINTTKSPPTAESHHRNDTPAKAMRIVEEKEKDRLAALRKKPKPETESESNLDKIDKFIEIEKYRSSHKANKDDHLKQTNALDLSTCATRATDRYESGHTKADSKLSPKDPISLADFASIFGSKDPKLPVFCTPHTLNFNCG